MSNLNDFVKAKGSLLIEVFDAEGKLKDSRAVNNLVVTVGKNFIASRMVDNAKTVMSHMAIGSGSVAPVAANTNLGTELGRVALGSSTAVGNSAIYSAAFPAGTGTGAITEAGIFNAASNGEMLARTSFGVVTKGAGDAMSISWTVSVI